MKRRGQLSLSLLMAAVILSGCPSDRGADAPVGILPEGRTPTEQMQATLEGLVEAQERHFETHGRYAEETGVLLEQQGFRPVGQSTVTIGFMGAEPRGEYLATASHPEAPDRCQVNAGRRVADQQPYTGSIEC